MKKKAVSAFPGATVLSAGLLVCALTFLSCATKEPDITIIWTDQPEFASYVELFNHSQNRYRVVVEYRDNPAGALIATRKNPDIVVGPWLKSEKTRSHLIPVDYLFNELQIKPSQFYRPLLDLGNIGGRQYLLPVSFNLPAIIFSPESRPIMPADFLVSLDQIQSLSKEYNVSKNGVYSRMGFSPRWDSDFLYLTARLYNAKFEEDSPLFRWNKEALAEAVSYLSDWSVKTNTSPTAEDDFQFKYLYDPPYKLVTGGRNLFSYMSSDDLFVLPRDKLQNIDFRWISRKDMTPVEDDIIYLGICKKAPHLEAAEAFLIWFFNESTQKQLLERSRDLGTTDRRFGISGGFSALKPVNEKAFPLVYPSLLGHLPPAESLAVPHILPNNWETLKAEIVMPYLVEAVRAQSGTKDAASSLEARRTTWIKSH